MLHTINLCRDCYGGRLIERGEPKCSAVWKDMIRHKSFRGSCVPVGWARFTVKKGWAKYLLEAAANSVELEKDCTGNMSLHTRRSLRLGNDLRLKRLLFT